MSETDKTIILTIDGETITVPEGTTLLDAARALGKDIPTVCYHEATTPKGLCRLCVVDVNGGRLLQPACITPCQHESEVETRSARVERSRRTILEMMNASINLDQAPEIQAMMDDYHAAPDRFPDAVRREFSVIDDNPFYVRDYGQCVLCWRCVQACGEDSQYTFALTLSERGFHTHVATTFDTPLLESPCVFCGQCIGVCPTGALKPKFEWWLEQDRTIEEMLHDARQNRPERGKKRRSGGDQ